MPLRQGSAGVSAEGFALTGDVYLWLGRLRAEDYTVNTPDGRPASPEFAGERLARVVCGDREMLSDADIGRLALAVAEAQVDGVANGIRRLLGRHSHVRVGLVTGLGDFIGAEAAQRAGLHVIRLAEELGPGAARAAPAAAVAQLLGHALAGSRR